MKTSNIAIAVFSFSVSFGLVLALQPQLPALEMPSTDAPGDNSSGEESLEYGSAHSHALFHVVVNGTELDFRGERYQLNSQYVHLENNRSDIVHKHAEGVTWGYFLETINVSVRENQSSLCINLTVEEYCGEGRIAVSDGGNLSAEIEQGDSLVIVLGDKVNATVEEYLGEELPEPYRRKASPGYRV